MTKKMTEKEAALAAAVHNAVVDLLIAQSVDAATAFAKDIGMAVAVDVIARALMAASRSLYESAVANDIVKNDPTVLPRMFEFVMSQPRQIVTRNADGSLTPIDMQ